jgi:GntR family transcriptional regulator
MVAQIANNRWRPGEAIPTEAALATEFDMSIGTVRKAVDVLVAEGVLSASRAAAPSFAAHSSSRRCSASSVSRPPMRAHSAESRILPSSRCRRLGSGRGIGLAGEAEVIRIVRTRSLGAQPVLAEIWLPRQTSSRCWTWI